MTRQEFLNALESLNVWKRGGRRAPHQPLLLLLALGRISEGQERLVRFAEIENDLRQLLKRFGPPHGRNQPEFPFWHLQSDGLWEIPGGDSLPKKKGGSSVPARALRKLNVRGGLPAGVDRLLRGDRELVETAAVTLLNGHFPHSFHTQIRGAVGLPETMAMELPASYGSASARKRDPKFRRAVLTAYERRCAICEFDVRLDDELLGLDAAHIKWHAAGGTRPSPERTRALQAPPLRARPGSHRARPSGQPRVHAARLAGTQWDQRGLPAARRRPGTTASSTAEQLPVTQPLLRGLASPGGIPGRTSDFLTNKASSSSPFRPHRTVGYSPPELLQIAVVPVQVVKRPHRLLGRFSSAGQGPASPENSSTRGH